MERISDRLKKSRIDAGFASATKAAATFKWNQNTYRSHENGEREFKRATATKYAKAFKISVSWLLFGEGDKAAVEGAVLGGLVTDAGRVMRDADGLDIELIGAVKGKMGLVLLVNTLDLYPRFDFNEVIVISKNEFDFSSDDSHTAGDRVWCYIEADGYRPMIAELMKFRGTSNVTIGLPPFGERAGERMEELAISTAALKSVRPVQAVVFQDGWRYRQTEAASRLAQCPASD